MDVHRTLTLEGNTLPIVWFRYNPHEYKINGKVQRTLQKDRERKVLETISNWQFTRPVEIVYMYYDEADGKPAIFADPDYDETVKELARMI